MNRGHRDPARRERYMNRYLSGRNWLIYKMYLAGKAHKQIAQEFHISPRTSYDIVTTVKFWLAEKAKDEAAAKEMQPC